MTNTTGRLMKAIAAAIMLVAVTLLVLPPSPAYAETKCNGPHYSSDYQTVEKHVGFAAYKWRVLHELKYRHCWNSRGRHWADPLSMKIGCRRTEGGEGSGLRDVTFDARYWDRDHHEIDSPPWTIECNRTTYTEDIHYFTSASVFHLCSTGGPRWDVQVKFDIAAETDIHTRLAGAFWGYTGPVNVTC